MAETFSFDFFQIPATGVSEPDIDASSYARTNTSTVIRRPVNMKMSNFGALEVGSRLSTDYTKTDTAAFKFKDDLSDVNVITEDTGIGQNVSLNKISVNHNPYLAGSTIKFVRDDKFIRMTMDKDANATVTTPKFDVMDTKESTADGINAATNSAIKNWPSEGWRSLGGKYDFLPYVG